MTNLEIILTFIATLSGIGNLSQWTNIRAMRAKSRYEAEDIHVQVLKQTIEMQSEEIRRLQERVRDLESRQLQREQEFDAKVKALQELLTARP